MLAVSLFVSSVSNPLHKAILTCHSPASKHYMNLHHMHKNVKHSKNWHHLTFCFFSPLLAILKFHSPLKSSSCFIPSWKAFPDYLHQTSSFSPCHISIAPAWSSYTQPTRSCACYVSFGRLWPPGGQGLYLSILSSIVPTRDFTLSR